MKGDQRLVVLGNTNVGKSTFLNNLLSINSLLNTNEMRETACLWVVKSHDKGSQEVNGKYLLRAKYEKKDYVGDNDKLKFHTEE